MEVFRAVVLSRSYSDRSKQGKFLILVLICLHSLLILVMFNFHVEWNLVMERQLVTVAQKH